MTTYRSITTAYRDFPDAPNPLRRSTTLALAIGAALSGALASPVIAQDAVADATLRLPSSGLQLEEIVVSARNREERAQDVPIPISVVNGDSIDRDRIFTMADLTQRAPGLTATTPNARRTGVSIRGIGKTSGNDNMEPAVGVIIDDVFLGHVGMSYQDFTDLAQVEILRGPQGTLLGKNTSLGAVKYVSRAPSFAPEGSVDLEAGVNRSSFKSRGSHSDAIIPDQLAYRASFFVDKQQGDIRNVNTDGGHLHEKNRYGGRIQFLYHATDRTTFNLNIDGTFTNEFSNTKPFMADPDTLIDGSVRGTTYSTRLARDYFGGYEPIIGSWDTIDSNDSRPLITNNYGISLRAYQDLGGGHELASITGARWLHFDAKNDSEQTRFAIARSGSLVDVRQVSQEFRLSGDLTSQIDYQTGVYFMNIQTDTTGRSLYSTDAGAFYASNEQYDALNSPTGLSFLQASLRDVFVTTNQLPESDSYAIFGQLNWQINERLRLTTGLRHTWENKTNQITRLQTYFDGSALVSTGDATADAIRAATIGRTYGPIDGDPIKDSSISWLINPSYSLTDDILLYSSVSAGEKSGAVAFDNRGNWRNVQPEKAFNVEVGIKSYLFDRRLLLNGNIYHTRVKDYQNVTSEPDPTSATGFSSNLGNIPGIRARGLEFDANILVTEGLSLTLGGAYNHAIYTDWSTATCPRSYPGSVAVCDNTGRQIVGAPRWTGIVGVDYTSSLPGGFELRVFGNHTYRSEHNLEQLLSPFGWQKAYTLTDAGIGVSRYSAANNRYDISIVAKNLFDTKYTTSVNDFSNNQPVGYDGIGPRRYVGVLFSSQF